MGGEGGWLSVSREHNLAALLSETVKDIKVRQPKETCSRSCLLSSYCVPGTAKHVHFLINTGLAMGHSLL